LQAEASIAFAPIRAVPVALRPVGQPLDAPLDAERLVEAEGDRP